MADRAIIIGPDEAKRAAANGVLELRGSTRFRAALNDASPVSTMLVERLDRTDSFYYIVSFESKSKETARVIVDGFSGEFDEASGIEKAGSVMPPFLPPSSALAALDNTYLEAGRYRGRPIRAGMVGQHPLPVWRPCRESSSAFLPFYQLSVGDHFVYVRLDGRRFDELTTGPV